MIEAPYVAQITLRCVDCDRRLYAVRSQKPLDASLTVPAVGRAMMTHAMCQWAKGHQFQVETEAADGSELWQR